MGLRGAALALALAVLPAPPAPAADDTLPVLIIYRDQVFERSEAGRALRREEEAAAAALVEEKKRIEAELEIEEKRLATLRATLPRAEFQTLADAFDTRVREARTTQDQKALAVQKTVEQNRQRFLDLLQPVLVEVMRVYGASVLLDGRSVLLADPALDITGEVIRRLDAAPGAP